ncbi:MAG TPA: hypothetical protein VFD43_00570 [Planctomycetota bacterium]|nr:hypothetical protein [Planctomycetota bacterium]
MPAATDRQVRLAGPFQQLVMIALVRLGPDTSADWIRRHLEHRTGRRISITAVHTTLQRLAARGYTSSWTRPPSRQRPRHDPDWWRHCSDSLVSHAPRRFHQLETPGRHALRLTLQAEDVLRDGLPGLGRESAIYQHGAPAGRPSYWAGRPMNRRLRKRLELGLEADPDDWLNLSHAPPAAAQHAPP